MGGYSAWELDYIAKWIQERIRQALCCLSIDVCIERPLKTITQKKNYYKNRENYEISISVGGHYVKYLKHKQQLERKSSR